MSKEKYRYRYTGNYYIEDVFGKNILKNNSNNKYVLNLQHYLNRYLSNNSIKKITVDGNFGAGTLEAVKKFQKYRKISADGQVGTLTKKHLINYVNNN